MNTRRRFLQGLGAAAFLQVAPALTLAAPMASSKRFVLIILRGALDGLAAVQPYGDPALPGLRDKLLIPDASLLKLDSFFALHASLAQLHDLYQAKQLEVFHAVATPYRERSHFDGQNVLETGLNAVNPNAAGWLNRCAERLEDGSQPAAMAVGQVLPRVLQGPASVGSWTPDALPVLQDSTLQRLQRLYAEDEFLDAQLQAGLRGESLAGPGEAEAARQPQNLTALARIATNFLVQEKGPVIAVLDGNGWDTHANQGALEGTLANRLRDLDGALAALKQGMQRRWNDTQVLVVTEFGRTVQVNGTSGTDHGTASVAFRAGGGVQGGKVRTQWPGLASGSLLEGRDLRPTFDVRELYRDAVIHLTGSARGFDV